jgi:WG containing repeat
MLYPVRTGGEYNQMEIGYLDDHGRIQFRIEAGNACGHYDGIAAVIRNGKVEILHEGGESANRTKADYADGPMFGHFIGAVESADEGEDERYGLLTDLGKWRVRPVFDSIRCWDGEYFSAKTVSFGRCSLFHKSGKVILEEYHLTEGFMSEDLIASSIPNDKRARSGFRRLDGEWQIKPRFDSATQFLEGRAFVTEGLGAKRKAGIIDRDGEWLRVFSRQVEGFTFEISEGTVGVYQGKTCALMALDGNILCEGEWNLAKGKVIGGVIPVVDFKSKQYGLLDTAGTWKVKPKFFDLIAQVGPFVVFRRDKGILSDIAVVNTAGEVLWEGPPAI